MKQVYAMLRADGLVKVGISGNPHLRRASVAVTSGQPVTVEHMTEARSDALDIESVAHRLLKEKHHQGEWFSATVEEAISAIGLAIDIVDGRAPDTVADVWFCRRKGSVEQKTERLNLAADPEFIRLLDEWRRQQDDLPSRSEALRRTAMKTMAADLEIG